MINFSIANHNSSKNSKGFKSIKINFEDIPSIVKSDAAYSSATFKGGHRKNDNWISGEQILILDIDDNCNIEQAKQIFKKYNFFLITTRSHQKEKNGIICDRFRIFIELNAPIEDKDIRDKFIKQIMKDYDFVDKSCSDAGRFFFSSPNDAFVFSNKGKKMKVLFIDIAETLKPQQKEIKPINFDDIYILEEMTGLWFNSSGEVLELENFENDSIEPKLKGARTLLDNEFYKGNRNHCLFKTVSMLLNDGLDSQTVLDFIMAENDDRGGVKFNELMAVYRSALKTTGLN